MTDAKRSIAVDDVYRLAAVEDPRISPDGRWIAYVHVTVDRLENAYRRHIWLAPVDGGESIQLTRAGTDSQPRWSPDGSQLAFVSGRGDKPQIYLLRVTAPGGEPRALTSALNGASAPAWSPDGTQIAFLARVNAGERAREDSGETEPPPTDSLEAKHRGERKARDEEQRWDPRVVRRIPYRAGQSYLDDRFSQIYVMPVDETLADEAKKPRRLTHIDADYEPPQWSPDGLSLLTARTSDPAGDMPWRSQRLYRLYLADGREEVISDDAYSDFGPRPSPDGRWIAYSRIPFDRLTERINRLTVQPAAGGPPHDLNLSFDRNVGDYRWSADGTALLFSAESWGDTEIYRVEVATGKVEKVVGGKLDVTAFDVAADGRIAFAAAQPDNPSDLYIWTAVEGIRQRTRVNQKFLDEVIVQPVYELRFEAEDGTPLQGWYMLPVGYEEGQRVPLAFNIHGGPHVMWGPSSIWHEVQCHAASGYAVFFCNPRGAGGYGEAFQMALHSAWGEVAFSDLMRGVDAIIAHGFVDTARMAVTGGSYGGYMTAWIVGHTERFAAAVSQRGVYNLLSFYGTSDVPLLITNEFDAEPWQDPIKYWQHSPLAYAERIKTPLLILHSENDFRVPISDGEQLFAYLRRLGAVVEMVRFPREGHELSRTGEPAHRVARLTHMIDWFDRYCK